MHPVQFRHSNTTLQPNGVSSSKDVGSILPLPVFTNGEQCISCWRMSWRERLSALFFGRVWVAVLSGRTQPPIYAQASKNYLEE